MKNLQDMKVRELILEIGLSLRANDFSIVFQDNDEAMAKFRRILRRRQRDKDFTSDEMAKAINEMFEEYSECIDKESLTILTLYNLRNRIESEGKSIDEKQRKIITKKIANAMRLLRDVNRRVICHEVGDNDNDRTITGIRVIETQELIKWIKDNKSIRKIGKATEDQVRRMEEASRRIGKLENVAGLLNGYDIENILSIDREVGRYIVTQISHNAIIKLQQDYPNRDIEEEALIDPTKIDWEIVQGNYHERAIADALYSNCRYIDIDKLLLTIAYRIVEDLENDTAVISNEKGENIVQTNRKYSLHLFKSIIANAIFTMNPDTEIIFSDEESGEKVRYSKEDLEQAYLRITDDKYYKKADVDKAKEKLLQGITTLYDEPKELTGIIPFEEKEFEQMILDNSSNLVFVIKEESRDKDVIYSFLQKFDTISDDIIKALQDKKMLDATSFINFFDEGKVNYSQIVSFGICKELEDGYINLRIKDIYCDMKERQSRGEDYNQVLVLFNNYASLYRQVFVAGKTSEEVESNGFNLVAIFEDDLSNDALQDLYQNGLITIETATDWGANLTEMFTNNELKPNDVKRLYKKGTIDIEQIRDILINGNLSNDEKEDFIYSTFDGDSEEEAKIRDNLIQLLIFKEEYKVRVGERKCAIQREEGNYRKEFVTDPQARWRFISLLDEGYSTKFLPEGREVLDGHRLFLLPAKDEIFIEKMRAMRGGRMESAYGSATYIMKTSDFFENIDSIVLNGAINRTFLKELIEEERVLKIIHSKSWHKKVMEHYEVFEDNTRYEEIRLAGEKVANSRRERE